MPICEPLHTGPGGTNLYILKISAPNRSLGVPEVRPLYLSLIDQNFSDQTNSYVKRDKKNIQAHMTVKQLKTSLHSAKLTVPLYWTH